MSKGMVISLFVQLLIFVTLASSGLVAQHDSGRRRPPKPPKEAIDACIGKKEGDSCEFMTADGKTIRGTCRRIDGILACVPDGPLKRHRPYDAQRDPERRTVTSPDVASICRNPEFAVSNIVDTGQDRTYDDKQEIACPEKGEDFYGQDAHYRGAQFAYRDNGDGTVTDLNTGLMWQKTPDFARRTMAEARRYAKSLSLAGHNDWRLPTIKELFSIADFRGNIRTRTPYINTKYFDFEYPDTNKGWRIIDVQYRSSTRYVGTTMRADKSAFGFNFADGRIKGYPVAGRGAGRQYVRCVRGRTYGENDFVDNEDGTITDRASGLMWMKTDNGKTMNWKEALEYAENLDHAGYDDWRLPNVKELQSIVDYSRAPDATSVSARGPAIDALFDVTEVESWYWTSTTHLENQFGYYVCFGQGFSAMKWKGKLMNAHGAGAVRSDPKSGDPSDWHSGLGPQRDQIRIYNYVRCVRNNRKSMPSKIRFSPAIGIGPEKGIMRRDPSDIIRVGDLYYLWYTKGGVAHGYDATVWYATSADGHKWTEKTEALARGTRGSWDEQSVFTPNILAAKGKYWLFYTAVPRPFFNRGNKVTRTAIGLAVSHSPDGPWERLKTNPILRPSDDPNEFDSMRVDDACLIVREGKYWLYYKGRQWDNTPGNTKMGVAIADNPEGPYLKHETNPVVAGGHEVLVWPYGRGVMAMLNIGPIGIRRTLQYADDAVTFTKIHELRTVPHAAGTYRPEAFTDSGKGQMIEWGVHIGTREGFLPFIERFDCKWQQDTMTEQDTPADTHKPSR